MVAPYSQSDLRRMALENVATFRKCFLDVFRNHKYTSSSLRKKVDSLRSFYNVPDPQPIANRPKDVLTLYDELEKSQDDFDRAFTRFTSEQHATDGRAAVSTRQSAIDACARVLQTAHDTGESPIRDMFNPALGIEEQTMAYRRISGILDNVSANMEKLRVLSGDYDMDSVKWIEHLQRSLRADIIENTAQQHIADVIARDKGFAPLSASAINEVSVRREIATNLTLLRIRKVCPDAQNVDYGRSETQGNDGIRVAKRRRAHNRREIIPATVATVLGSVVQAAPIKDDEQTHSTHGWGKIYGKLYEKEPQHFTSMHELLSSLVSCEDGVTAVVVSEHHPGASDEYVATVIGGIPMLIDAQNNSVFTIDPNTNWILQDYLKIDGDTFQTERATLKHDDFGSLDVVYVPPLPHQSEAWRYNRVSEAITRANMHHELGETVHHL